MSELASESLSLSELATESLSQGDRERLPGACEGES
jgi:hypothetical protein